MSNYKLIALDLDGTLLTSQKTISKNTYEALKKAVNNGIYIVPCTGRFYESFPECVKELPFVQYVISINGAEVYDVKNKKTISSITMDNKLSFEILKYFDTLDVIYDTYIDNWGYMDSSHYSLVGDPRYVVNPFYIDNIKRYRKPVNDLKSFVLNNPNRIQKLQFFSQDPEIVLKGYEYISLNFEGVLATRSESNDCEVNHIDANKGNAIKILADYLNIDINDTIAFGDGGNDITMIETAGLGIGMGNAKTSIKAVADFLTLTNDEDGIAYAIDKFVFDNR